MDREPIKRKRALSAGWCRVGATLVAAAISLAGCTGSGSGAPSAPPTVAMTPTAGILCTEQAQRYEELTRELTSEDLLARVLEADVERVRALLYPDDHPRAGDFIPVADWDYDQKVAWDVYITTRGNWPVGMNICSGGRMQ